MLKSIRLQYFRQHLDRTFEFGPGLNAIRGEVEAGKTTITEAFNYLCFGTAALRESLEDVVTYHQPVSKLRVDGTIEHLGVTYTAYRGKSGAEVNFGSEKITGQREVTKFFEKLFGADAKMAGKLMFVAQKSLAESLKAGATEAGRMIEDLANFDLIDHVAEAIASRRQTGNTAGVEARVATLREQLVEQPAEDLDPLRAESLVAKNDVTLFEQRLTALRASRAELDVEQANDVARQLRALQNAISTTTADIARMEAALKEPAVLAPTEKDLLAARAAVEEGKQLKRAAALAAELHSTDVAVLWDKDLASLEAEIASTESNVQRETQTLNSIRQSVRDLERQHAAAVRDSDVKIAQLEGRLIKESTCALCQKDLADVPEVARTNSDLQRQIDEVKLAAIAVGNEMRAKFAALDADRLAAETDLATHQQYLKDLQAVVVANAKAEQLYARAADFVKVDRSTVPGQWRWTGLVLEHVPAELDARLAQLERQNTAAVADAAARAERQQQLARLMRRRDDDIAARDALPVKDAEETLTLAADMDQKIRDANIPLLNAQHHASALATQLAVKEAAVAAAARQREQVAQQLAGAEAELAAMQKYNLLIKKVRAARPVITNKLWNIVLGGVSKHLSEIRDQTSTITRADGMFKCNGFPVSGLSGSAEDMLGLAMRITLTRTFLPGVDMLQLDEPAAACSDAREAKMLGLLSTLGFGQILLITHSDQADAFADRIINV